MTTTPKTALFCAHADANGDASRCACTATPATHAPTTGSAALDLLRSCQGLLMCARMDALVAAGHLTGPHAGKARRLAELVVDAQCLCGHLGILTEADASY